MPPRARVHEPRRGDCPWCGSESLRTRLRAPDLRHRRPGTFVVDECRDCRHAFQNPRLTPEGLELYAAREDHRRTTRGRLRVTARTMLPFPSRRAAWTSERETLGPSRKRRGRCSPTRRSTGWTRPPRCGGRTRPDGSTRPTWDGSRTPRRCPGCAAATTWSACSTTWNTPGTQAGARRGADGPAPRRPSAPGTPGPGQRLRRGPRQVVARHDQPRHLHLIPQANLRAELESRGCEIVVVDRRSPHAPGDWRSQPRSACAAPGCAGRPAR